MISLSSIGVQFNKLIHNSSNQRRQKLFSGQSPSTQNKHVFFLLVYCSGIYLLWIKDRILTQLKEAFKENCQTVRPDRKKKGKKMFSHSNVAQRQSTIEIHHPTIVSQTVNSRDNTQSFPRKKNMRGDYKKKRRRSGSLTRRYSQIDNSQTQFQQKETVSRAVQTVVQSNNSKEPNTAMAQPSQLQTRIYAHRYNQMIIQYYDQLLEKSRKASFSKNKVIQFIKQELAAMHPEAQLFLYGSQEAGLSLHDSDLDLSISPNVLKSIQPSLDISKVIGQTRYPLKQLLTNMRKKLVAAGIVQEYFQLFEASIPILKMTIDSRKLGGQISVKVDLTVQLFDGKKSTQFIKQLLDKLPSLQALTMIVKSILAKAKLNTPYKGGLSSFSIVILIASFLKYSRLENQIVNYNQILPYLIAFYSTFDQNNYCVYFDQDYPNPFGNYQNRGLYIVDPVNKTTNMASRCTEFQTIKKIFADFHQIVTMGFYWSIREWVHSLAEQQKGKLKSQQDWQQNFPKISNPLKQFVELLGE